jgi:COP9 signalosome complex subunit 6
VPFQKQITSLYNETGVLLAIHPEAFAPTQTVNQRLPITIYESISETEPKDEGSMQVDGEDASDIKFRPVPYTVETDEAEMIAIDYVAKGAGGATAVSDAAPTTTSTTTTPPAQPVVEDKKGKKRASPPPSSAAPVEAPPQSALDTLTPEESDSIATITTRLNSVRMLQTRLTLISKFLSDLPPSYITDQSVPLTPSSPEPTHLPHLRNITSLLTRLNLLTPPTHSPTAPTPLSQAQAQNSSDVLLSSLLSTINRDVAALGELGRKFATIENARGARKKQLPGMGGFGMMGPGGMGMIDLMDSGEGGKKNW